MEFTARPIRIALVAATLIGLGNTCFLGPDTPAYAVCGSGSAETCPPADIPSSAALAELNGLRVAGRADARTQRLPLTQGMVMTTLPNGLSSRKYRYASTA